MKVFIRGGKRKVHQLGGQGWPAFNVIDHPLQLSFRWLAN
jgi:hypothetical protein